MREERQRMRDEALAQAASRPPAAPAPPESVSMAAADDEDDDVPEDTPKPKRGSRRASSRPRKKPVAERIHPPTRELSEQELLIRARTRQRAEWARQKLLELERESAETNEDSASQGRRPARFLPEDGSGDISNDIDLAPSEVSFESMPVMSLSDEDDPRLDSDSSPVAIPELGEADALEEDSTDGDGGEQLEVESQGAVDDVPASEDKPKQRVQKLKISKFLVRLEKKRAAGSEDSPSPAYTKLSREEVLFPSFCQQNFPDSCYRVSTT